MLPPVTSDDTPPFDKLGWPRFERLCRAVLAKQASVSTYDVYGEPGQTQDGIDLLAFRADGDGVEVGQCKCYLQLSPAQITDASDALFNHLERWQRDKVRRFILFVACDTNRRAVLDRIIEEQKRFAEAGVTYEVWSATRLTTELSSDPLLVAR